MRQAAKEKELTEKKMARMELVRREWGPGGNAEGEGNGKSLMEVM